MKDMWDEKEWNEADRVWKKADKAWQQACQADRAGTEPATEKTTTFLLRGKRLRLFWRLFRAAFIALATGKATLTLRNKP